MTAGETAPFLTFVRVGVERYEMYKQDWKNLAKITGMLAIIVAFIIGGLGTGIEISRFTRWVLNHKGEHLNQEAQIRDLERLVYGR